MKTRIVGTLLLFLTSQAGQTFACSVCFADPKSKSAHSMATAIWFLMGAVMSVLGGVGAFSFHLWRHARMPLEPHQELAEEDLKQYD
ncbi:MAG: hypothetical protein ACR2ID_09900 [Chthoniobacterales bacterium]